MTRREARTKALGNVIGLISVNVDDRAGDLWVSIADNEQEKVGREFEVIMDSLAAQWRRLMRMP